MYQPNHKCYTIYEDLKQINIWKKVRNILKKYKEKWDGPDIPIYILPMNSKNFVFQKNNRKSGVAFPDKLFLFFSKIEDDKEIEAVFVHEYHHVCRMNFLTHTLAEYTLLDSIIMEGLAEDAVYENVGKKYVAEWSHSLPNEKFEYYWKNYLKEKLALKRAESGHDHLLYGKGLVPNMLGYTCGYHLVREYKKENHFSTKVSFSLPSNIFIK
jgi:uncharacterized protein YjaZ